MKLLEHEAKALLGAHRLPIPDGRVIRTAAEAAHGRWPQVLKAQIHSGRRGKAGGVKVVHTASEATATAAALLGQPLLGRRVEALLTEAYLDIERELYLALVVDRSAAALMLLAHPRGGVEIESAPSGSMLRLPLVSAPTTSQTVRIGRHLELPEPLHAPLGSLMSALWDAASTHDAVLIEINPLALTRDGRLVCADAKVELDDAAHFRHPDWNFADQPQAAQFVPLHPRGAVASIANGAGLAMATIDAIQAAGATPANFCDVGGGTNEAGLVQAFERINAMRAVRAIVVNIFGGITRCDEVARAIITARRTCPHLPPLFIRLVGTNATAAHALLAAAGLPLLATLDDCVRQAAEAARG